MGWAQMVGNAQKWSPRADDGQDPGMHGRESDGGSCTRVEERAGGREAENSGRRDGAPGQRLAGSLRLRTIDESCVAALRADPTLGFIGLGAGVGLHAPHILKLF